MLALYRDFIAVEQKSLNEFLWKTKNKVREGYFNTKNLEHKTRMSKSCTNRIFGHITGYLVIVCAKCLIFHPQPRKNLFHICSKNLFFPLEIFLNEQISRIWSADLFIEVLNKISWYIYPVDGTVAPNHQFYCCNNKNIFFRFFMNPTSNNQTSAFTTTIMQDINNNNNMKDWVSPNMTQPWPYSHHSDVNYMEKNANEKKDDQDNKTNSGVPDEIFVASNFKERGKFKYVDTSLDGHSLVLVGIARQIEERDRNIARELEEQDQIMEKVRVTDKNVSCKRPKNMPRYGLPTPRKQRKILRKHPSMTTTIQK